MRRDLIAAALVALMLAALVPAYDRVFSETSWRSPVLVAAVLALVLAVVVRHLRRGAVLAAIVSAVALASFLPWLVGLQSRPVMPSSEHLEAVRLMWSQTMFELAETPAPAPVSPGLVLILVVAFWTVTHVSHELAARWRRPGLALIALTVLWAAPLAVPMSAGRTWPETVPFLAAAVIVLLLTANSDGEAGAPTPRVSSAGLTVGAAVVVLATLAPAVLPGYGAPAWVGLGGGSDPRGYQPIVDVSDRLRLPTERDVLRVEASQRTYLRLAGLDSFDGFTWRLGPASDGSYRPDPSALYPARHVLPPEQPAASTEPVYVDVTVLALENIYVPVPYQPVEVLGPQRDDMVWSTEGGFLATWDTTDGDLGGEPRIGVREGFSYRVQAARPTPRLAELEVTQFDEETLARWTALPHDYPALEEAAEAIYDAAGATTAVERALALQDWFVGRDSEFTYDLDVPALRGDDALERFVLEDKVGYCEYFATAMAVMLRATGIPARVAVGFLPGRVTNPADPEAGRELTEYTVSTGDAHAWVEVLFPGHGWVTFEPTPRSDETQVVPTAEDMAPLENERERRSRELREQLEERESDSDAADGPDEPTGVEPPLPQEDLEAAAPGGGAASGWTTLWLVVGGLAAVAVVLGLWRRRRLADDPSLPAAARILRAQRRLLAAASRYGIGRRPPETIREVVARWRDEARVDDSADAFATAAQAAAFGGAVDDEVAADVHRTAAELEAMLRASVEPRDRLMAPVRLPVDAVTRRARGLGARAIARRREREDATTRT